MVLHVYLAADSGIRAEAAAVVNAHVARNRHPARDAGVVGDDGIVADSAVPKMMSFFVVFTPPPLAAAVLLEPQLRRDQVVNGAVCVHFARLMPLPQGAQLVRFIPIALEDAIFEHRIDFGTQARA